MSGDGLVPPLNAPPAGQLVPGVQPGTSNGIVLAQYVVVFGTSGGVFLYSGTPAAGNAPVAWMSTGTTDPYGNTLTPASNVVIGAGQDGNPQVVLESSAGTGELAFPLPGTWTNYPNIFASLQNLGGRLSVNGPTDTNADDQVYLTLASAGDGFDSGSAGGMWYNDANGGINEIAFWGDAGMIINAAAYIYGVVPGTGGSPTNPAQAESVWHAMTLANSWANTAGNVTAQYRKIASPPNNVELIGAISAAAATSTTFFTLPAGYRPVSRQQFATGATGGVTANTVAYIQCAASTGVLTVERATIGAADTYAFHGLISLDA